jgi:hypothetical protein
MGWLEDGLPLTLLCDLVSTRDPESQTINLNERPTGDALYAEAILLVANSVRGDVSGPEAQVAAQAS